MKKVVPAVDKLRFKINFYYPKLLVQFLFKYDKNITCKQNNLIQDSSFKQDYFIYYKNTYLGHLGVSRYINNKYSQISIENHILYNQQNILKEFLVSLDKMQLDIEVSSLEIAIDYNGKAFRNKIERLIKNSKLKLASRYGAKYYGFDYDKNSYKKHHSITRYLAKSKKQKFTFLRLENKTKEIENSKKQYITNYHAINGLDINQDVYRLELIIPLSQNFICSNNVEYRSNKNDSKTISKVTLKKYENEKIKLENKLTGEKLIFDNGYNRLNDLINEYTIKENVKSRYDIDFTMLFDKEYLLTIFNTFGSKIILNSKNVFPKFIYRKSVLSTKKIKMLKKEKINMSNEQVKEFNLIAARSEYYNKSFDEVSRNFESLKDSDLKILEKEKEKTDLYAVVDF